MRATVAVPHLEDRERAVKPAPTVWDVWVTRTATTRVLVKHADPVEARRLAVELASDWDETIQARAYTLEGRPSDRVWTEGEWLYPETSMFEEGQ